MELTHTCIITDDVSKLKEFYEMILQMKATVEVEGYVEFKLGNAAVCLFDRDAHEAVAKGSVKVRSNQSVLIEVNVDDVDLEYERLLQQGVEFVKGPTTQEWGTRSIYFRDLDGNLLNFYTKKI